MDSFPLWWMSVDLLEELNNESEMAEQGIKSFIFIYNCYSNTQAAEDHTLQMTTV